MIYGPSSTVPTGSHPTELPSGHDPLSPEIGGARWDGLAGTAVSTAAFQKQAESSQEDS